MAGDDGLAGAPPEGQDYPIAVIGLSCRLPQASDPAAFWRLLREGVDAISAAPVERFGRGTDRPGGYLNHVDRFDPGFFGISPREAVAMDPQQRLALELAWEALEDAGIVPDTLGGSSTGVFIGAIWDDYTTLLYRGGPESLTPHTLTGTHRGIIANRISSTLGLHGPSFTVDATQASSLLAVHLATESLRRGESTLALVGGINLPLVPTSTAGSARFGGLSPEGRCFTFDARANGYVRGEGGGIVVLKPLARAVADGDFLYCVIRGSAVNNGGGTPALTVPSAPAQVEVIGAAYRQAGVDPQTVQYVELHGTGTKVGDPIEAAALGTALGAGRPSDLPLLVGSVKTNIGHLEGAAGIAGLLKTALSIRHRELPPSLHFQTPNPDIDLDGLRLRVRTTHGPWPRPEEPLLAGVSSFGMGGTNCHVVLSEPPTPSGSADPVDRHRPDGQDQLLPWVISGRTPTALRAQAARLKEHLDAEPGLAPAAVGWSLATTRSAFQHRAVALGTDREGLLGALEALARGNAAPSLIEGTARDCGKTVLVFPGQGSQWVGMALDLVECSATFRDTMDACAAALARYVDFSPLEVLRGAPSALPPDRADVIQPLLFAVMVALARVWQSLGIGPDAVVGHSQGEIAAAHVAGALSLEDAARVAALPGQALATLSGAGGMASIALPASEVQGLLSRWHGLLRIAAVNSPSATVVSGDPDAVASLVASCAADGVRARTIPVDYASHSPQVAAIEERMLADLAGITPRSGEIAFYSAVTGEALDTATLDARYWYTNLRQPVLFDQAVRALVTAGHRTFIEASPHAVLTLPIQQTLADAAAGPSVVVGTLRRDMAGPEQLLTALAELHVNGVPISWPALFDVGALPAERVKLPTYAFQRKRYWPDVATTAGDGGRPMCGDLGVDAEAADPVETGPAAVPPWAERLAFLTPDQQRSALAELIRTHAAIVLGHVSTDPVDTDRPFKDLGVDSPLAVQLRNRLTTALGLPLSPTLIYDHPTPAALVSFLHGKVFGGAPTLAAQTGVAGDEPIAIVGMACRFPGGVTSPEDLWDLLIAGREGIGDFPATRGWDIEQLYDPDPDASGKTYVRQGGFLAGAELFDAAFFGISPREATAMDPQQRLLLEIAWETLERSGIDPASLRGSRTGVFVGMMSQEYGPRLPDAPEGIGGHLLTGTITSVASGRVAYVLGLEGPAITVDTACSSSLVALHLACQAIRHDECTMALAGGIAVMSSPGMFVEFSRQRGLAPDGRCKPFAAAADGTAWGEGGGLVLLERVSDAHQAGHRILAVIRGSAINQDGTSNGLSAPHGPAQQRVIHAALTNAGLTPTQVDVVEAHGTGTTLGDPIEAGALLATYGQHRPPEHPLWLGSLKSNIGHTQTAAGIASVIKIIQALHHDLLPLTLHVDKPTPHVDWSSGAVKLLTDTIPWPRTNHPRRAGVSSFGISGTNAHLILEDPPAERSAESNQPVDPAAESVLADGVLAWVLSARSERALRDQAERLLEFAVADNALDPADIAHSLLATRGLFQHRAAMLGKDREELLAGLASLAAGEPAANVVAATAGAAGRTVFVFPGQGSQWEGMALDLLAGSRVFREHLDACAEALTPYTGWSLLDVLRAEPGAPPLDRVDVVQPALFAVMTSLARLWESFGVRPDAVLGHSQGEIAAAYVAGALTLDDATKVVAVRSRALTVLAGTGAMASLPLPAERVDTLLSSFASELDIAAINGPASTVVAGAPGAVAELIKRCQNDGIQARTIPVDYASHAPQVERIRDRLVAELADITPRAGAVAFCSAVTGEVIDTTGLDATYWYENLRRPIRLEQAVRILADTGHHTFIETSPHPVLTAAIQDTLEDAQPPAVVLGSLRRDDGGVARFVTALAQAQVSGVSVDWAPLLDGAPRRRVDLPTYAFQRQPYWLNPPAEAADVTAAGLSRTTHPLLGASTPLPDNGHLFTGNLSLATHPWLADHKVHGTVLLPGTAFVDLAVYVADQVGAGHIDDLTLPAPLVLPARGAVQLHISAGLADDSGNRSLSFFARPADQDDALWTQHATATLAAESAAEPAALDVWPPAGATPVDTGALYDNLAELGLGYGPAFQGLDAAWRLGDDLYAEVTLPDGLDPEGFGLHPALLDACLHTLALAGTHSDGEDRVRLPFGWSGISLHATGVRTVRVKCVPTGPDSVALTIADTTGAPVAMVESLVLRPIIADQLAAAEGGAGGSLFWIEWTPTRVPEHAEENGSAPDLVEITAGVDGTDTATQAHEVAQRTLALVQQRLSDPSAPDTPLVVVTQGAVATHPAEKVSNLANSVVWGLLRSARSEHPGRFVLVDVDGLESSRAVLAAALATGEPELALREGQGLLPRLVPAQSSHVLVVPAGERAWRLDVTHQGALDNLMLRPAPEATRPLCPTEVRLAVRAAGLNFRDVLATLGMVPGQAGQAPIVSEAAGVVLEVGAEVKTLAPGQRVMGLVSGAAGPLAVTDHRLLAPIPVGWSFTQAAGFPVAFLTAYHALAALTTITAGERVLIHAGTGGVGMAALQLAQHQSAEIYATASPSKWPLLRELGLDDAHIASSRTLEFRDQFLTTTHGEGMDLILNCLAGEFTDASLALLPRGGRFLDIGKTDIRDPKETTTTHPGVHYHAFDVFDMIDTGSERIQQMLVELVELAKQGALHALPTQAMDVRHAPRALRYLQHARHTGKLILTIPQPINPHGTVLITGGTGTLGSLVAERLVTHHGARHLLLTSRRGPEAPGAFDLATRLEELGVQVSIIACDTADPTSLAKLLRTIPAEHPLTAVVHTAGVLDDGAVPALTPARLDTVLRPKVDAAHHLHELTKDLDLAAFVLFSSAAGALGTPGQANYAAANTYLDTLAHHRHAQGLPATSLAWGLWAHTSDMTSSVDRSAQGRLARNGILPLSTEHALALFDRALDASAHAVQVPIRLNLAALRTRAEPTPPMLSGLVHPTVRRSVRTGNASSAAGLREQLSGLTGAEQEGRLLDLVRAHVAAVLGHGSAEDIQPMKAFRDLGFDSLTAVELRNRLNTATGLRLPTTTVFDYPTPAALAGQLRTAIVPETSATARLGAVLAELDHWETTMFAMPAGDDARAQIASRLRSLLRRLADGELTDVAADGLESATDEELFQALDSELGTS